MTVRRRLCRTLALAAVPLLLAGCTAATGTASGATSSSPATGVPSTPVPDTSAPADSDSPSPTPSDDAPVLVLQGDGLGLLGADSTVQPLPFATTGAQAVRQAVEDALGPTTATALPDCPQGPRTALVADGFSVLLDGDRFVGWTDAGAADQALSTADGVGIGSRLDDLQSALPDVKVAQGPAGTTWSSPSGLSGLLSGPDPAADVTAISGGQACAGH